MTLNIAQRGALDLPLDFVTERIAFLARTGAGKSGGMRVLFEEMLYAQQFAVFIDPKGDAWGIRAAGSGPGRKVLVMGGDHGDVPLQPTGGKFVAEFLVSERVPTVLDISDFTKADMVRFVTDCALTMYRKNRDVMHVFLDEADMIVPQNGFDPHCIEAVQFIQNKGRGRGFGMTVASQRSAMINKSVLFASGTLVAMQTTGPRDIKTAREWLEVCGTKEATELILSQLPTLKTREAFVYSPQHLGPEPKKITFRSFSTFDSMRTPKPGETRQQPKSLADVDLAAIQRDMAATIEAAKANDPAELRKRIAQLEREAKPAAKVDPMAIENATRAAYAKFAGELATLRHSFGALVGDLEQVTTTAARLREDTANWHSTLAEIGASAVPMNGHAKRGAGPAQAIVDRVRKDRPLPLTRMALDAVNADNANLPKGERAVLIACAQDGYGADRTQISILTGYKRSSRDAYLQRLKEKNYVEAAGDTFTATSEGVNALGPDFEPLPTGAELRQYWINRLPEGERKILERLCYHGDQTREQLSDATEYKRSSRDAYIQRLKARKLVTTDGGTIRAAAILFD